MDSSQKLEEKIIKHLSSDKVLKVCIQKSTFPKIESTLYVFQGLIKSIVSQQLSVKAAAKIYDRFIDMFPNRVPDAQLIICMEIDQLRKVGLSQSKSNYVQNVSNFFLENENKKVDWTSLNDNEIIAKLTSIKGVGIWTAHMILMFTLGRIDVFPSSDLGIRNAMIELYKLKGSKVEIGMEMEKIALKWKPYRTIASMYLWEHLNNMPS